MSVPVSVIIKTLSHLVSKVAIITDILEQEKPVSDEQWAATVERLGAANKRWEAMLDANKPADI